MSDIFMPVKIIHLEPIPLLLDTEKEANKLADKILKMLVNEYSKEYELLDAKYGLVVSPYDKGFLMQTTLVGKEKKMNEQFLITLGENTTETEYKTRADTVQKWWGLWGLCAFKTGYEQRGK